MGRRVYDGLNVSAPVLANVTGTGPLLVVQSTQASLFLMFGSDDSGGLSGFTLSIALGE